MQSAEGTNGVKGSGRGCGCISRHEKELSRPGSRAECPRLCWEGPEGSKEPDRRKSKNLCDWSWGGRRRGWQGAPEHKVSLSSLKPLLREWMKK